MDATTYVSMKEKLDPAGKPVVQILKTENSVAVSRATFDPITGERMADAVEQIHPEQIVAEKAALTAKVADLDALLRDIEATKTL